MTTWSQSYLCALMGLTIRFIHNPAPHTTPHIKLIDTCISPVVLVRTTHTHNLVSFTLHGMLNQSAAHLPASWPPCLLVCPRPCLSVCWLFSRLACLLTCSLTHAHMAAPIPTHP